MDFTVRFKLGLLLLLVLCCSTIVESAHAIRQIREINETKHVSILRDETEINKNTSENQQIDNIEEEDEKEEREEKVVAKLNKQEIDKPKTEFISDKSKELHTAIINKQTNKVVNKFENSNSTTKVKLEKSEPYKKTKIDDKSRLENVQAKSSSSELSRESIGRSIDIDKYVSKEFHNRNNVYTLPVSSDSEKFINPDYDFLSTTTKTPENVKDLKNFDIDLTTPKSHDFDKKYTETMKSVNQMFDHIDSVSSFSAEPKEDLDVVKFYEKTKNNDTKAELNYIQFRNITKHDNETKNSSEGNLIVEEGRNLHFESSFNNTHTIDESPVESDNKIRKHKTQETESVINEDYAKKQSQKRDNDKLETSTIRSNIITTRKSITLTKPPSNRNNSHISILNNKIETETVKSIDPIKSNIIVTTTEMLKGDIEPFTTTDTPKKSSTGGVYRGSIKFANFSEPSNTQSDTNKVPSLRKNSSLNNSHKIEQLFQENQIVPVLVEAPEKNSNATSTTTISSILSSSAIESTTVNVAETTETTVELTTTTENVLNSTRDNNIQYTESFYTTLDDDDDDDDNIISTTDSAFSTVLRDEEVMLLSTTETTTLTTATQETTTNMETTMGSLEETSTPITTIQPPTIEQEEKITTETATSALVTAITENDSRTSKLFQFKDNETVTSKRDESTTEMTMRTTTIATETPATETPLFTTSLSNMIVKQNESFAPLNNTRKITDEGVSDYEEIEDILADDENKKQHTTTTTSTTTTTTDIIFVHIENVDINHTTLLPEIFKPEHNYPSPDIIDTKDNRILNATLDDNTTETSETDELTDDPTNRGTIAAIIISSVGGICLILLAGLLIIMRKRQKRFNYGQRCRPVSLDDYSMDNISVHNSIRRKGVLRNSKRSYGNPAFEDPASISHPLNFPALGKFANNLEDIKAEFDEIPQISARTNELPEGCDVKNRYANIIPLPETRVFLSTIDGYPNSDYINANYVTGPKNTKGYYIACQAPMENTVDDFWRMIWEQQSKVILMLTLLFENRVEKCFDYLPPSEVLDCHRLFGDFQVTLKKREVKDKYIISSLQLKNMVSNSWREITHFWYLGWPEKGVPAEANSLIAYLIEARSYMKSNSIDRNQVTNGDLGNGAANNDINPVVVHCSPGTGRTGVAIACDIAIREFEQTRLVDVPKIVYKIRRDRANSVQTKEQYAFIYKVINLYATKLTGGGLDSL